MFFYIIKLIYRTLLNLIYTTGKNTVLKSPNPVFDSRTIEPPRSRNPTERMLFEGRSKIALNLAKETKPLRTLLDYKNPSAHASIYWMKYRRDKYTIAILSRILWDEIVYVIHETQGMNNRADKWVIAFAPSTSFSSGLKNWDHNQDILDQLQTLYSKQVGAGTSPLHITFENIFSVSEYNFISNKKLRRKERIKNTKEKFVLSDSKSKFTERTGLIIFDDVMTTGSTLLNLGELAQKMNPELVIFIAISH